MAGVSLECGPLLTPVEEAPDLSDFSDSAACGTARRSTAEIDLDSKRIEHTGFEEIVLDSERVEHAEIEGQTAKVAKQISLEVAKVDMDMGQPVGASSNNTPEGNSILETAADLNDPDIGAMPLGTGKRIKKKGHVPPKEKQAVASSPKSAAHQTNPSKSCPHLAKGFDWKALSEKIGSSGPGKCQDCQEGAADKRGAKGKGKHGKKKGKGSGNAKKAIWVCLQCGHYSCGGVGFPGIEHHAIRHHRQTRHPLVIQWENSHLRWCFKCNKVFRFETSDENGDNRDALLDVVKLMKLPSPEKKSMDVENVWSGGGGSGVAEVAIDYALPSSVERTDGYLVRGLTNLGNTCFFNSVMQNLLAMDSLRDYFLNKDASFGPLSTALKKLFAETRTDTGMRNVINPRSLFGCVCSKAPQFRGYQQQDSHELLRCLLDGLSTEELDVKKQLSASDKDKKLAEHGPTFVDSSFGGRISSTVSCLECGHSSTVFEPFLDLSLPVPAKKPPAKRVQPAARAKKTKLPPKRGSKNKPKASKDTDADLARSVSEPSVNIESPEAKSGVSLVENVSTSLVDNAAGSDVTLNEICIDAEALPALPKSDNEHTMMEQTADSCYEEYSWMDFVGTGHSGSGDREDDDFASQSNNLSACPCPTDENVVPHNSFLDDNQVCSASKEPNCNPNPASSLNPWEEEVPLQVASSGVLLLTYKEESFSGGDTNASSSVMGNTQENGDFDGFGDLFNEPEVSSEPMVGPSLMATNGSDSDPNEVDDTYAPVSVDSCLLHFIKPELLINDNAWECDNCSSNVKHQVFEKEMKHSESTPGTSKGGGDTERGSYPSNLDHNISSKVRDLCNGHEGTTATSLGCNRKILGIDNEGHRCRQHSSSGSCGLGQSNPFPCNCEIEACTEDAKLLEETPLSTVSESCNQDNFFLPTLTFAVDESCSNGEMTSKDQKCDVQSTEKCESRESENRRAEKPSKQINVKRDATKRVLLDKAPLILTIHLKRFSQDARGRLTKLNGHVNFGETLDLRSYIDPRCIGKDRYEYHLLGVVEHLGTIRGGHYVAYVRGESKSKAEKGSKVWYHASDTHVREVSLEEVLRSEAYILFYEKV